MLIIRYVAVMDLQGFNLSKLCNYDNKMSLLASECFDVLSATWTEMMYVFAAVEVVRDAAAKAKKKDFTTKFSMKSRHLRKQHNCNNMRLHRRFMLSSCVDNALTKRTLCSRRFWPNFKQIFTKTRCEHKDIKVLSKLINKFTHAAR